jgi:acetolactate synthase I/II/III large subunit
MDGANPHQASVAESFLRALKNHGVDYVLANAGTDFAPVIEGLVRLADDPDAAPKFLTVPHENVAVSMAHGYHLVSGKQAAAMVHVTVGTGNTICSLMNAYRDNVPLLLMAGRTPHTQTGHIASRSYPIHWGQENFDQAGMVREYTKWDYELRAGQPVDAIVARALEIANAPPRGPVYLTLPREVLADIDTVQARQSERAGTLAPPEPSAAHVDTVARWITQADFPLIVTSHLGRDLGAVTLLAELTEHHAIPVVQAGPTCVNLPASHPMNVGQAGGALLDKADLILVIDSEVPWFPREFSPRATTRVAHFGIDPLCVRYPIRSFPTDLAVPGSVRSALTLLRDALQASPPAEAALRARRAVITEFKAAQQSQAEALLAEAAQAQPISYAYVGKCIRDILPEDGIVVTELGASADQLALETPGSLIGVGLAGGLGFGLGASLGAKLAAPERTVICTVGDGSYMFGNPTPFHFVARAHALPVLTVVCNNNRWHAVDASTRGVYPDGRAATSDVMPLVELKPSPEFSKVAEASDAYARRIDDPADLPDALEAALAAVERGQQALLDVRTEHGQRSRG